MHMYCRRFLKVHWVQVRRILHRNATELKHSANVIVSCWSPSMENVYQTREIYRNHHNCNNSKQFFHSTYLVLRIEWFRFNASAFEIEWKRHAQQRAPYQIELEIDCRNRMEMEKWSPLMGTATFSPLSSAVFLFINAIHYIDFLHFISMSR